MRPDTLGEIYDYTPSLVEWMVAVGVFSVGFPVFAALARVAVPIMSGQFRHPGTPGSVPAGGVH
jgi:molybdopterin-containing oxidoreductase family membrane subunit